MDGFFGSRPAAPVIDSANDQEGVDLFAQAIAGRFNNPDKPMLTARLTPSHLLSESSRKGPQDVSQVQTPLPLSFSFKPPMTLNLPAPRKPLPHASSSSSSSAMPTTPSSDFTTATASTLQDILKTPNALIVDVRPHSAYDASRLPHAVSLSVPSTLLKRPKFGLQQLALMLSSASARSRIQNWAKASRILVYDADSATLQDGSNILGLMRKFRDGGFRGDIAWLQGGIQSLWRDHRHLVDEEPVSEDEDESEGSSLLRARHLPQQAFQSSTISLNASSSSAKPLVPVGVLHTRQGGSDVPKQEEQPRRTAANPFFDNIRQNLELSQGITERIPLRLSPKTSSRVKEIPFAWLRSIAKSAGRDDCTDALAMQFYRIELGEQRRLQGIMAHHSGQSGSQSGSATESQEEAKKEDEHAIFPYSIIAGVEKGGKNRYRNIWPFEHSRVRLQDENDDYVNASFVQPLGTRKRYIATQGPMRSTFADFWSVVWDQGVRVIIMLTKQFEGGSEKCGKYWLDGQYGPFRLKCTRREGSEEEEDPGGFLADNTDRKSPSVDDGHNHTIRRVFEIVNTDCPEQKPRTVTQLQYLGWPDMDVPANPKSLLKLMLEVDALTLVEEADETGSPILTPKPILMHCSAGVGRTGAFIIIDAILDAMRHEIRSRVAKEKARLTAMSEAEVRREIEAFAHPKPFSYLQRPPNDNTMDVDLLSVTPSVYSGPPESSAPTSDADANSSETSSHAYLPRTTSGAQSFFALRRVGTRNGQEISDSDQGQVATLELGDEMEDIHVPYVPSNASPAPFQTPRAAKFRSLAPEDSISSASTNRSVHKSCSQLLSGFKENQLHQHAKSNSEPAPKHARMASPYGKPVLNDFTNEDADSMFEKETNPDFAMDIESVQPQHFYSRPHQTCMGSNALGGQSGSSGSATGMNPHVRVKDDSGSGSGSGSGSDCHLIRPLRKAFADLSSADDESGSMPKHDSSRLRIRGGIGGPASDGSGSGEGGSGGSGSDFSMKTSSGSARSGSSSVGLDAFASLGMGSPSPSMGSRQGSTERLQVTHSPTRLNSQHQNPSFKLGLPMSKPSLLQPKPLRLQPSTMPELIEGVECSSSESASERRARPTAQLPLRHRQGKRSSSSSGAVRSPASSTSSVPSSSVNSLLLNSTAETYETPPSTESFEPSRSPSAAPSQRFAPPSRGASDGKGAEPHPLSQETKLEDNSHGGQGFHYTQPRALHRDSKDSPPLLSNMEEPIRQILEDMREQRMSLCQSLRQYVFVHNAIVEGAIMILDQECEAAGECHGDVLKGVYDGSPPALEPGSLDSVSSLPDFGGSASSEEGRGAGKRRPSPTELPKEDKKGGVLLTKRQSLKRGKSVSPDSNLSLSQLSQ